MRIEFCKKNKKYHKLVIARVRENAIGASAIKKIIKY